MPPLRSSAAIRKRSSCTRTVTGCLTCRQRRVKCDGAAAPCANCRRLSIKCIPSFSSNFRTWATSSHDAPSSPTLQPPEAPIPHSLCAPDAPFEICAGTEKDPVGGGTVDGHPSAILSGEEWSMTTDGLEGPLCSTPSPCCASSVRVDGDELDMLCGIGLTTKNIQPLHNTIEEYDAILQMRNGLIEFPFVGCSGPDSAAGQHTTPPSSLSISDFRDRDRLAEHYNGHLIGFLSVKTTTWNFYSYILQKVQKGPDSTLKHGVLAWAESHRSWSRRPAAACPGPHYLKADACLRQLQEELTGLPTDMMSGYNVLDKLNSLLATSLFLSHCDVMYGDHESLISRLDSLKRYLTPRWHSLMEIATGVQLRVLIWLAYLDLRATLWTVPSASSQPTDYAPRDRVGDLFDLLRGSRTDDSVRQLKDSKYYLVECFGSIYPEQELRNDLSEEPWKLLSDDAMILFCDIKAFYGWCHQLTLARKPHGLYDELREAKIRALRSDIARIRAECNQIHSEELQAGHGFDYAARVQSHFLRCTCLHLSATILLNRINNPDVRTDSESQEAAREIIQITQQLKKAGDLRFPRSIAWPLPLFLAGIEVEDEVYQDWVLAFMEGLSEWGGSVMKATALLRQIMDKQAVEGVRISPWHAMMELGETIIV